LIPEISISHWPTPPCHCPACTTPEETAAVNSAVHARFPRYVGFDHEQERLGLTGSLQWQPSDNLILTVDTLYSRTQRPAMLSFEIDGNGSMVDGKFERSRRPLNPARRLEHGCISTPRCSTEASEDMRIDMIIGSSESNLEVKQQTTMISRIRFRRILIRFPRDDQHPKSSTASTRRTRPTGCCRRSASVQHERQHVRHGRLDVTYDITDLDGKSSMSWKKYGFDIGQARDRTLPINSGGCVTAPDVTPTAGRAGPHRFFLATSTVADRSGLYDQENGVCFPLVTSVNDTASKGDFGATCGWISPPNCLACGSAATSGSVETVWVAGPRVSVGRTR
jgi:hypothetical protein